MDSLFVGQASRITFVKCDVEGHELQCVLGASSLIRPGGPSWLIEVSSDPDLDSSPAARLFEVFHHRLTMFADPMEHLHQLAHAQMHSMQACQIRLDLTKRVAHDRPGNEVPEAAAAFFVEGILNAADERDTEAVDAVAHKGKEGGQ